MSLREICASTSVQWTFTPLDKNHLLRKSMSPIYRTIYRPHLTFSLELLSFEINVPMKTVHNAVNSFVLLSLFGCSCKGSPQQIIIHIFVIYRFLMLLFFLQKMSFINQFEFWGTAGRTVNSKTNTQPPPPEPQPPWYSDHRKYFWKYMLLLNIECCKTQKLN